MVNPMRPGAGAFVWVLLTLPRSATSSAYTPDSPTIIPRSGTLAGTELAVGVFDGRTDTARSIKLLKRQRSFVATFEEEVA